MKEFIDYHADYNSQHGEDFAKNELEVLNLIIYEGKDKIIFYNLEEKRIFLIKKGNGLREIEFKEAIREIDIIPTEKPAWKRLQILKLAKELGFFGIQ